VHTINGLLLISQRMAAVGSSDLVKAKSRRNAGLSEKQFSWREDQYLATTGPPKR
jgi:hypothetical protein